MRVVNTVDEMLRARRDLPSPVAMMATLGAMHAGHEALLDAARREGASLVTSLFLNPTQFDDPADFEQYEVDTARDLEIFERHGVDVVFQPTVEEMYPPGSTTSVDPGRIGTILEGAHRPGHFRGVATVVTKILVVLRPDIAVWGAKDAQQNIVIRRLSTDLRIPVRHVIVPTVRAPDGLALSSRNARLSPEERAEAPVLHRALMEARELWRDGGTSDAEALREAVRRCVATSPIARIEYVSLADANTLYELDEACPGALLSLAASFGATRLIDNVTLD